MAKVKKEKVDLNSISQAHGALPAQQAIAEFLGVGTGYAETTLDEYNAKIEALTDSDLHEHAVEVGIVPGSNRVLLVRKLQDQFLHSQRKFVYKTNPSNMSDKNRKAIEAFMKGT